ncbi:MAG: hypothetical protein V1776_05710 [Candidatus Diapherotrites archaeon]
MRSTGQAAIDLLLALLLVLVVMGAFAGVVTSYTETQKQIGIHQQLAEDAILLRLFLTQGSFIYHEDLVYPSASINESAINTASSLSSHTPISPIRAFEHAQGIDCALDADFGNQNLELTVLGSDAGLSSDVKKSLSFSTPAGFETMYDFTLPDCFSASLEET